MKINLQFIISLFLLYIFKTIYCIEELKLIYKFSGGTFLFEECDSQLIFDELILNCHNYEKTFLFKYSIITDNKSNETYGDNLYKREYLDSNIYIDLYKNQISFSKNVYLSLYNNDKELLIKSLVGNSKKSTFILLKDKSMIFSTGVGALDYLQICKYEFPSFKESYCDRSLMGDSYKYYYLIDFSDKIIVIREINNSIRLLIFDSFLNYISSHDIDIQNYNYKKMSHFDTNKDSIIICCSSDKSKNTICFDLRFNNEELIIGKKFEIFPECYEYINIVLLENNKIAAVCTTSYYDSYYRKNYRVYLSTVIYEEGILKFDKFNNKKFNKIGSEDMIPSLVSNQNYGLILYLTTRNTGNIFQLILYGYCQNFYIDDIIPGSKNLIDFKNYIYEGIDGKIEELYIYTNDKNINIYKGEKNEYFQTTFNINDKIYFNCEDHEGSLSLFYGFNNRKCQIKLLTQESYIKINDKSYRCLLDKNIKEINNIKSVDLENKRFYIVNNKNFNFTVIFEKKITEQNPDFYFLNTRLNCKRQNEYQIYCEGILPFTSKLFEHVNYVYSKLSCSNMIKVGPVKITDKYLLNIYEANNLTSITNNINKKYNPAETIKTFSVDMISYYMWFSSFGYCDDKIISLEKCCKKQILDNWELIDHKKYNILNIEKDNIFYSLFEFIKKFNVDNHGIYYYNFAILKSVKYKKFVVCLPGTSTFLQLIGEIFFSGFTQYSESKNTNVMKYFYDIFKRIHKDIFSESFIKNLKEIKDYQIIFTGHSLGGAIATLISYYYADEKISSNEPVLITFGQPRVGDLNFAKDYMRLIPLVFRVAREKDIVTKVPLRKKLNIDLNIIESIINLVLDNYKMISGDILLTEIIRYFIKENLKKISIPYGYSHIGGLYLLKNNIFYHCSDFYNEDTGHPICRNIDALNIDFSTLNNHGYLKFGDDNLSKCQKDKKIRIIGFE